MDHSVSERPQIKPLYFPNNGSWKFQAYNYKEEMLTQHARRRERMSLDETRTHLISQQSDFRHDKLIKLEEITKKKQKQQSSSSSGRFVSLFNAFFSQLSSSAAARKKRSINSSWKDEEENDSHPGDKNGTRMRRRSSTSQFLGSRVVDSRSLFLPCDDHKQGWMVSGDRDEHGKTIVSKEEMNFEEDAEFEFPKLRLGNPHIAGDGKTWQGVHCHRSEEVDKEKVSGEYERYDSDSSSDLFELKKFD